MNTEGSELKFTKLDGRHRGNDTFKYYVTIKEKVHSYRFKSTDYVYKFFMLRGMCVALWGMSCERELYLKAHHEKNNEILNNHWAWHTDLNNSQYRIYLKSDEERAWLLLKWQNIKI